MSSLMCFAYGGPHARVSSPRVGCSIFMISALSQSHHQYRDGRYRDWPRGFIILNLTMPTRGLQVFACSTAFQIVSQNGHMFLCAIHTPARTLVMSRTRISANGSVEESAAAVARPLQSEQFEPMSCVRGLRCLARPEIVLEIAIVHGNKTLRWRGREKRK